MSYAETQPAEPFSFLPSGSGGRSIAVVATVLACCCWVSVLPARGQFDAFAPQSEISGIVQVEEVDHAAIALVQAAKTQFAQGQWTEGFDRLQQADELAGDKLWKIDSRRYVPLRTYCQITIANLPEAGLAAYRERVDPLAKHLFERAARRDAQSLETLLDRYFSSAYGDEALVALGDLAFEQGKLDVARANWRSVSRKLLADGGDQPLTPVLTYPDSNLDLAGIRARIALASIVEGDLPRAKREISWLREHHPGANGMLGGRKVEYAAYLQEMLEQAADWPKTQPASDEWPTFAGDPSRQHVVAGSPPLSRLAAPLARFEVPAEAPITLQSDDEGDANPFASPQFGQGQPAACYFPVVARGMLLFSTESDVFAVRASDGEPAWNGDSAKPGRIYSGGERKPQRTGNRADAPIPRDAPRFTLTVYGRWLLARMGSQVTASHADRSRPVVGGEIICLDLEAEGRLQWKLKSDERQWAFDGTPLCDADQVYVAMRRSGEAGRSEQHVACFDLKTGRRIWRSLICTAESLSHYGDEVTHNLLTLAGGTLYFNTNAGAIASLDRTDGRIRWLTTYPRQFELNAGDALQSTRPAVYASGTLYAAPSDYDGVMAIEAHTGRLLWESGSLGERADLFGITGGKIWLGGQRLIALDARSGQIAFQFPSATGLVGNAKLAGCGRGVLGPGRVFWPVAVRTPANPDDASVEICVVDARAAPKLETHVPLPGAESGEWNAARDGGNLVLADRSLVIAGPQRISLFQLPTEIANQENAPSAP